MAQDHKSNYVLTAEDRTRQAFASLERSFNQTQRMLGTLRNLTAGAFSVASLVAFANKNAEAERAANRLTAVINAQGHAAGFTRRQLDDMADSMAAATQFDDEDFRNAEATLLKFGNVYGDVFKRALQASADLAAFQGTDLSAGIEAVGKALQNPAEGLKQLQSQIGKLDPAQRKMLENLVAQNRVVEAQNMLLDILQKKIGGTAALMNGGYSKALSDTAKNFEELLEAMGKTGAVQGTVLGFFNFLNQSLKDIKSIIEAGDWFGGLLFLLGGRGHELSAQSVAAKRITDLMDQIDRLERGQGVSRGVNTRESIERLRKELELLQKQYDKTYGAAVKAAKAPKPKIDTGPNKFGGDALPGRNRNLLGLDDKFFRDQEDAQRFGEKDLEKQRELVGRQREILELKADNEAFAKQLADDDRATRRESIKSMKVYLDAIDNETAIMGLTNSERNRMLDLMRLEEEQRDLVAKGTAFSAEEYANLVEKLKAARDAQDRLNQSWEFGANNALRSYLETVRNVADTTERLITKAFQGMEDALVTFVETGKLSFRDLAQSIISDLIRIQIQQSITGPLANFLGGLNFGGGGTTTVGPAEFFGVKTRALGGPVSSGMPYWVGEQGPELFVPRSSGSIVATGAGGNVTINQSIHIDSRTDQASIMLAMVQTKEAAKAEIRKEMVRRPASRP